MKVCPESRVGQTSQKQDRRVRQWGKEEQEGRELGDLGGTVLMVCLRYLYFPVKAWLSDP